METIIVTFDLERSKQLYKKYFEFEKRRVFQKIPSIAILSVCIGFIVIGIITKLEFLKYFGIIMLSLLGLILLYYKYKFQSAFNNFSKALGNSQLVNEGYFKFKFDNERISHESENARSELTWKMIQSYFINEGDIYLFLKNNELYDIISESIIGFEKYEKFRLILITKVNRTPEQIQHNK